jgi:hypothetical protein
MTAVQSAAGRCREAVWNREGKRVPQVGEEVWCGHRFAPMVMAMKTNQSTPSGFAQREPYVTKRHVAAFYGFTPRWVELKVAQGMPCRKFGKRVRFRMSEIEVWLRSTEPA